MFTDILESSRLAGIARVCDRLVPVVSALDHDHHDHYHSDNSEGASSVSCRSESPEPGAQTGGDTDNEDGEQEDSETEEREQEELRKEREEEDEEEEEESSPGTGRSSPAAQATPNSAMSISPANSEVGSRLIQNLGGSSPGSSQASSTSSLPRQANTPYVPKKRYEWGKARKNVPDRADLDTNWRQSASGPASDKSSTSSTSSGEREVVTSSSAASSSPRTPAASRSEAGVKRQDSINSESRESRADLDSNWRDHITTTLPPSGAKTGKFKNKNQKQLEKGI